jgi:cytosine/adenosine deaminase-related metal-dependent hydrolase
LPATLLRNGLVDAGGGEFRRTNVLVENGRIAAVGDGDAPDGAEVVDCSRFAVVPGIVNAHNHSNENYFRGCWDNLPLEPWMLFSYPVLANPTYSEREIYVRTLLGGLEMVRSGCTCVVDYVYELAGWTDESIGAVVQAYRDLGLRAVVVIGMSDRAYHESVVLDMSLVPDDLLPRVEEERPPPWSEWEAFARRAVERYHRPDEGITVGLGPSGPQRCTDEMLAACAKLADELDLTIHIHVLETRMQALSGIKMYGRTLPEHLNELGFLGPRVSFEHGIWLTESDTELVSSTRTSVTHNPFSNLKLGSGIAPIPVLLDRGVNIAMGSDGMSSNDGNDMYATLKIAGLLHKLWDIDYERWLGATEAWRMATRGGAQAAGDDGLGELAPGRRADLVLLDLESRVFTPLNDPLRQLVFCSATSAVDSTMVGGRWAVRERRVTGVDEAAILAEGRELGRAVVERHGEAWKLGERLLAAVRGGWLEALGTDVGVNRSIPL